MAFNMFDFLLVLVLLLGIAWGMIQGIGRLLIGTLSLYVGLVAALLLYLPLAKFLRDLVPAMSLVGSQALAFVILLFLIVNGLSLITFAISSPEGEWKRKQKAAALDANEGVPQTLARRFVLGPLTYLVKLVVGSAVAVAWISLVLAVLQFAIESGVSVGPTGTYLRYEVMTSALVPTFNKVLDVVYQSVSIWLPGDSIPVIFGKILQPY
jgi:Colicin V production protein